MNKNYYQKASELMKAHKYELAIKNFELHLQGNPQDYKALMQQGICYYLNDSEEQFLGISHKIENLASTGKLTGKIKLMWNNYKSLARKVAATAMITGTLLSSAACDKSEQKTVQNKNNLETTSDSQNKQEETVIEEKTKNPTAYPAKKNPDPATVKSDEESENPDNKDQADNSDKPAIKPMAPASHHRYSAGVYRKRPLFPEKRTNEKE